ncbi:MAG: TrkA family potassium uptake protein [Bacteroidales bacterium]|nr:TrkA family potassium uptake protein [Bacteroidales bacterium]
MRFLIIGLGIYGANLAKDLTDMGHEVIGADIRHANVDAIKDYISTAYIIDSTDEAALAVLPLRNIDVAIVAIGENFGASVKTVALLKKMGVKPIYARAIDPLHQSILEGFEVQRILLPEQRAAWDLVYEMELGSKVECLEVDYDHYVLRFQAPKYFLGMKYQDIDFAGDFGLTLIAVAQAEERANIMGMKRPRTTVIPTDVLAKARVEEKDIWTVYGTRKAYRDLFRHIN